MSITGNTDGAGAARSVRLVFEYEGDSVRLVAQHPVDLAVMAQDSRPLDHPGYYVDARDAQDATLARVPAPNAFVGSAEVFPEKPGEPITRIDVAKPRGAFTVVIPAPEPTHHLTVLRIEPGRPATGGQPVMPSGAGQAPSTTPQKPEVVDLVSFPFTPTR